MNEFRKNLKSILDASPFEGNQRALALHTGLDRSLLHHVLGGKRAATPQFVGRLCSTLPPREAAGLLQAFLADIVAETASVEPVGTAKSGLKRQPLSDLAIKLECQPRRKAS